MKGSVSAGKGNSRKEIIIRRGLALLFAGCVLTGTLAACGDKDKDKDKDSSSGASGTSSIAPISSPTPTPLPTAKAVRVEVDDSLNVRESGSTDANILGSLNDGDELALLTDTPQNGWYQVSYNGGVGYVSAQYVKVIDVTVERYNALKESGTATATAAPESSTEPSPGASTAPADGQTNNSASSDSEDGE